MKLDVSRIDIRAWPYGILVCKEDVIEDSTPIVYVGTVLQDGYWMGTGQGKSILFRTDVPSCMCLGEGLYFLTNGDGYLSELAELGVAEMAKTSGAEET